METTRRCPACRARIAATVTVCPACGARLKKGSKSAPAEGSREAPADPDYKRPKKKKKKKEKSGPNYPLFAGIGGGVLVVGIVVWLATIGIKEHRESTAEVARRADANKAGGPGPEVAPAPVWTAKADPPKGEVRPKDDLAIPIEGEPLFASGLSPFVVDLVAVRSGVADPPKISVYDVRTGERTQTANALQHAQSPGRERNSDFYVALGPDGKTLAAWTKTTTGTGRKAQTTSEVLIYRLGKDEPVARIPVPVHLSWMEFGRDEDQLIVISAPTNTNISATAYDLKKPGAPQMPLRTQGTWVRWRDGGFHPDAWVVSPGRNYLAAGGGRAVDLIQLSDGQSVASLPLPGDCVSVAFSPDGKELTAHSWIAPPKRGGRGVPTQHQWTTFSLADGKQVAQTQVTGGPVSGAILAAGPKPGLAVYSDRNKTVVTDTRIGAPVYTTSFPATRCIDDRLIGYDASAKRVTVQRIDPERLA
ncbi:MAG: hypothetical protein J2P46_13315, partial [Zavarzinella sp.]|nr:hypothetical protein [Zavarzinella sp.]